MKKISNDFGGEYQIVVEFACSFDAKLIAENNTFDLKIRVRKQEFTFLFRNKNICCGNSKQTCSV